MDVTKMRCTVLRAGVNVGQFDADLIFIDGRPYAVFEWQISLDGSQTPIHMVALDPSLLQYLIGWGEITHLYETPVEDPRKLS